MKTLNSLIIRNIKIFFKDKTMFFVSLITPIILLLLFMTFLGNVYKDVFLSFMEKGTEIEKRLLNGFAGGELVSSILAVSCVTVSFCANMVMVQDKANGTIKDLLVSPAKKSVLALSYYIAALISTLTVCLFAGCCCFVYLGIVGWYLSFTDVILIISDILLMALFGTALSSFINIFLKTQGQMAAVGTIVSSCYGFISGAYMPLSQFPLVLKRVIMFLPGTYGTSLLRRHSLNSVIAKIQNANHLDSVLVEKIKDSIDCNLYFFNTKVSEPAMYLVLIGAILLILGTYIVLNVLRSQKSK